MLWEKEVEKKLTEWLRADLAAEDAVSVVGGWDVIADPDAAVEQPGEAVRVLVTVGAPAFDTYEAPTVEFPVSIAVAARRELDLGGALFERALGAVEGMRLSFQLSIDALQNVSMMMFSACGARAESGDAPTYNAALAAWTVARSLTIKGVISQ